MVKIKRLIDTIISLFSYRSIVKTLKSANSDLFFIFSSYQIGGAERVHAEIMSLVADRQPVCIITSIPVDKGFKELFSKSAKLVELKRWGSKRAFIPFMAKKVAKIINKHPHPVVFGSNNRFIYDVIPFLGSHVKIIDLTHSFSTGPDTNELYSLKAVSKINHRVVLGEQSLKRFKAIYKQYDIEDNLTQRIKIISNKITVPSSRVGKDEEGPIEVIFVSRNSHEKRPDLFFRIVDASIEKGFKVNYTIIGNFKDRHAAYSDKIDFVGEIHDKNLLNDYYAKAHVILITSIYEGFPMVLLEGMAYGVVPISTDVGEIPNFISEKQQTGVLIDHTATDEQKIEQFTTAIEKLATERSRLKAFSDQAVYLVKEKFGETAFKDAYTVLLKYTETRS